MPKNLLPKNPNLQAITIVILILCSRCNNRVYICVMQGPGDTRVWQHNSWRQNEYRSPPTQEHYHTIHAIHHIQKGIIQWPLITFFIARKTYTNKYLHSNLLWNNYLILYIHNEFQIWYWLFHQVWSKSLILSAALHSTVRALYQP